MWGRDVDVEQLRALLESEHRAVVTGPPGIGKTRLLREVVQREGAKVYFADVRAAHDLRAVLGELASVLEVPMTEVDDARRGADRCAIALDDRGARLVVLDNAEHLIDEVCGLADQLRSGAPKVRVAVGTRHPPTSAWPLLRVGPLDAGGPSSPAVRLFVDIAGIDAPSPADYRDIESWVELVGGNPLGIRLSAASAQAIGIGPPRAGSGVLRGGIETAVARSWSLLSDDERRALLALTPFPSGFRLDQVEPLLGAAASTALHALVRKSLIDSTPVPGRGTRRVFRIFPVVREHALAQLDASPQRGAILAAHDELVLALTERHVPRGALFARHAPGPAEGTLASLRDCLDRALADHAGERALRAVTALSPHYAYAAGAELVELVERALVVAGEGAGVRLVAAALAVRAHAFVRIGGFEAALAALDRGLALTRGETHAESHLWLLMSKAEIVARVRPPEALVLLERCGELLAQLPAPGAVPAHLDLIRGIALMEAGRPADALVCLERSRVVLSASGAMLGAAVADVGIVACLVDIGRLAEAEAMIAGVIDSLLATGQHRLAAWTQAQRARLLLRAGKLAATLRAVKAALPAARATGDLRCETVVGLVQAMLARSTHRRDAEAAATHVLLLAQRTGDSNLVREALAVSIASAADDDARRPLRAELDRLGGDDGPIPRLLDALAAGDVTAAVGLVAESERTANPLVAWLVTLLHDELRTGATSSLELVVAPDGTRVTAGELVVDLRRRATLRRVLLALVRRHRDRPGDSVDTMTLFAEAWPGEHAIASSATNRVHVAIGRLRRLGLDAWIQTRGDGFALDPRVSLQ